MYFFAFFLIFLSLFTCIPFSSFSSYFSILLLPTSPEVIKTFVSFFFFFTASFKIYEVIKRVGKYEVQGFREPLAAICWTKCKHPTAANGF